ncbi:MAG TPA: DegT/DnrJ/EryC1/StrS family aminotransferase [Nitrosopumilaceae archaeon]|nr:DegT/DnrJ/EryC1/StrS family aminotransferase [Nitrosopumilaceae archaeon]
MNRFDNKEVDAVRNVIENGKYLSGFTTKYLGGEEVQKFEEEFAKYVGVKHALSVNSGTMALFIIFKTAMEYGKKIKNKKLQKPDIHIPAYTFTADVSAALLAGGKIVFEDIDKMTYCMLPPKNHSAIVVPTHLLGNAMSKVNFGETDFSVEDCCHSLGTTIDGKRVGGFGTMSIFSFQETKHITTLGEGGMICSNNEELIKIAAAIRNHAEYYQESNFLGYNFRMIEAQAAFGRVQLKKLKAILKSFRNNAKYIISHLPDGILPPFIPSNVEHSFLMIGCLYDEKSVGINKKIFLEKLTENRKHLLQGDEKSDIKGINMKSGKIIGNGYSKPLYEIPMYRKYKPKNGCPNVEDTIKKALWMDIHRFREREEISEELDILSDTVREFQK